MTAAGRGETLIVSGGFGHPFTATSGALSALLAGLGFRCEVTEDVEGALGSLGERPVDLVTLNTLRWRMLDERYAAARGELSLDLGDEAREGIHRHLARGGGILALHAAPICFDGWEEWRSILGAAWRWGTSTHPPLGPARIRVVNPKHPLVAGIGAFDVVDEIYGFLDCEPDLEPLLTAEHGGAEHPLLWAREAGGGRIVYDALGHDERSFAVPEHRTILRRSALWASGREREAAALAA